ncbi:MAG: Era-like GTP-binding protein [Candidatus Jordarchaeales archaeon]
MLDKISRMLKKRQSLVLGVYGAPNAGKTTLANRISLDFLGVEIGTVSPIPHETRKATIARQVNIRFNGKGVNVDLVDMPGIASKVDYRDFMKYGLNEEEAVERAKEATRGVIEAIQWLDNIDLALTVFDATKVPFDQVNLIILGNLKAKRIPTILVANKIDLPEARPELIRESFPGYKVVCVSALRGDNMEELYKAIAESC